MTELVMPDSEYCYETRVFGEGKQCPDFDGTISMEPKCRKYNKRLSWTRSGIVLKCEECQGPEGISGRIKKFHAHLDVCSQCERHPFDLCPEGARLLKYAATGQQVRYC
jgi:hypothetical protein